jgi:diguanylate cyclase (GGDEF)-like protein/PAS domain S-box-containing protein
LRHNVVSTESIFRRLAENSPIGIYLVQNGCFRYVNREFENSTGFKREDLIGRECLDIVHPDDRELVREAASSMLKGTRSKPYEYRGLTADGGIIWILETVTPITYEGQLASAGNFMNITERKTLEEKLRERARQDSLTGLLNHGAILEELRDLLDEHADSSHSVILADVRSMKQVNDENGHQAGDAVLYAVAQALSVSGALVGRYGGDEFVAILPDSTRAGAEAYKERVHRTLSNVKIRDERSGRIIIPLLTLGSAVYPADGQSAADLISVADEDMYNQRRVTTAA